MGDYLWTLAWLVWTIVVIGGLMGLVGGFVVASDNERSSDTRNTAIGFLLIFTPFWCVVAALAAVMPR